jgi:hypothetical protein
LKDYQGNGNVELKELGFGDMNWEGFAVLMCLAATLPAASRYNTHKIYQLLYIQRLLMMSKEVLTTCTGY